MAGQPAGARADPWELLSSSTCVRRRLRKPSGASRPLNVWHVPEHSRQRTTAAIFVVLGVSSAVFDAVLPRSRRRSGVAVTASDAPRGPQRLQEAFPWDEAPQYLIR